MSESEPKFRPSIFDRVISRRKLIVAGVDLAVAGALFAADLADPQREDPLYLKEISPEIAEQLLEFDPILGFHNDMDNKRRYKRAIEMPMGSKGFLDIDVVEMKGKLHASHNPRRDIPIATAMAKFLGLISWKPRFEKIAQETQKMGKKISVDMKNLGLDDFPMIQAILEDSGHGETALFNSNRWDVLEEIGRIYGPNRIFYSIGSDRSLARFVENEMPDGNMSLARHLVTPEIISYLKRDRFKVIAFTVNDPEDALNLLRSGIDGFVSDHIGLLSVFGNRDEELEKAA